MKISREEVLKIANLARLSLADAEVASMTKQLGDILEYVDQLKQLDTANVEPTAHVAEYPTPMRKDEPRESIGVEAALANAPKSLNGAFIVPRISLKAENAEGGK